MLNEIQNLTQTIDSFVIDSSDSCENFYRLFLSKKGKLSDLYEKLKNVPSTEKPAVGKSLNTLKHLAQSKYDAHKEKFKLKSNVDASLDLTLPGYASINGARHPVQLVMSKVVSLFENLGFSIVTGPEIEDDWHNFTALNFEADHPARQMQDTFFININPDWLLRTHTSSVQIRTMEKSQPPFRCIAPGRVYRNEAISARSHCYFHQIEGFYVDKNVSFADLKACLTYFAKAMFGNSVQIRLRPSYFPFTELSAEMDVSCQLCHGVGCNVCKHTGWVEVLGCGMIDPAVLQLCNIDPEQFSGYAFGFGIERMALLTYRIPDIRLYSQNDLRFLHQFAALPQIS